jgi:hypothetical protein
LAGASTPSTREHTSGELDAMSNPDGTTNDPEALGDEREEYPDPESYPAPHVPAEALADGAAPDPDVPTGDVDGQT